MNPISLIPALAALLLAAGNGLCGAPPEKIAVAPEAPYYLYLAYESIVLFWVAILGLLVIIRMKLRETERIQELELEREDPDVPLLQ